LAENLSFRNSVKAAAQAGLPIYAECGGLMYLGEHIQVGSEKFPMVGIFPYDFVMGKKPQAHGYTILEVTRDNPYLPRGVVLKGHEFHYSQIVPAPAPGVPMAFTVRRGSGIGGQREGLLYQNVLATYTHLHALGSPQWAAGMVRRAREHRQVSRPLEKVAAEDHDSPQEARL
ncbi:MAG TPA: cobyrinic acid a,c-diamide synthase, partial [Desulfobaccales bacterium]